MRSVKPKLPGRNVAVSAPPACVPRVQKRKTEVEPVWLMRTGACVASRQRFAVPSAQSPEMPAPPSVNSGVRSVTDSRSSVLPAGATIAMSTKPRSSSSRMPLASPSAGSTRPPAGPRTAKVCVSARFVCVVADERRAERPADDLDVDAAGLEAPARAGDEVAVQAGREVEDERRALDRRAGDRDLRGGVVDAGERAGRRAELQRLELDVDVALRACSGEGRRRWSARGRLVGGRIERRPAPEHERDADVARAEDAVEEVAVDVAVGRALRDRRRRAQRRAVEAAAAEHELGVGVLDRRGVERRAGGRIGERHVDEARARVAVCVCETCGACDGLPSLVSHEP